MTSLKQKMLMKTALALTSSVLAIGLTFTPLTSNTAMAKSKVEQELKETHPLAPQGVVHIDNVNGKIEISAWDRPEIEILATKRANTQADLDAVKIEIDSKPDQVRIHTRYPSGKWKWNRGNSTEVNYVVKVPAQARLQSAENVNGQLDIRGVRGVVRATTVNGRLSADGLASDTQLESVNGTVEAVFEKLEGVKSISVKTVNGTVKVTLPGDANADVSAKTVNGSIRGAPPLVAKKQWPVGMDLKGQLGKGGTRIAAETVNGAIHFFMGQAVSQNTSSQPAATKLEAD